MFRCYLVYVGRRGSRCGKLSSEFNFGWYTSNVNPNLHEAEIDIYLISQKKILQLKENCCHHHHRQQPSIA